MSKRQRRAQREIKKRQQRQKARDKFGNIARINLFGVADLTPFNAGRMAKHGVEGIKFK